MSTSSFVICIYEPKAGKEAELTKLRKTNAEVLREQKLITNRPALALKGGGNMVIEIFEWVTHDAYLKAYDNPHVHKIWEQMGAISEFKSLSQLPGADKAFPNFDLLEG